MVVIVASRFDEEAQALIARWAADGAALLTCEDLSTAGWVHQPNHPGSSMAVVSGDVIPTSEIAGVLVRRAWIFQEELTYIAAADREFVAAEMNAFLLCWLAALRCAVINPSTPSCLSGPLWSEQQWVHAAAGVGMRVRSVRACGPAQTPAKILRDAPGAIEEVTVVDQNCFGANHELMFAQAKLLAAVSRVRILSVRFMVGNSAPIFLSANPFPRLTGDEVLDALRGALLGQWTPDAGRIGRLL
jgi:hypothetical protein